MKEDISSRKLKLLFKYIVVIITLLVITVYLNTTYKEYHWYFLGSQLILTILTGTVFNKLLKKIK